MNLEKVKFFIIKQYRYMFCRKYHCKAENPHGVAFHDIELEEAHEPGELQQAILDKSTATTLQFRYLATSTTVQVPSH